MRYQEIVVATLTILLNQDGFSHTHLEMAGVKNFVKLMIRHYPEITPDFQKTWKNLNAYKAKFQISKRAAKILADPGATERDVYFEHIVPVGVSFKKLIVLKQSHEAAGTRIQPEEIADILGDTEIVILSREEAVALDGNRSMLYPLDGAMVPGCGMRSSGTKEERLNAIGAELSEEFKGNHLGA